MEAKDESNVDVWHRELLPPRLRPGETFLRRSVRPIASIFYGLCSVAIAVHYTFAFRSFSHRYAELFGLGQFGWLLVELQMIVAIIASAIAAREVVRSPKTAIACFNTALSFSFAGNMVIQQRHNQLGVVGLGFYWLFTTFGVAVLAYSILLLRTDAAKRRAEAAA